MIKELYCELCNFSTEHPSKMIRHKNTHKHKIRELSSKTGWTCECNKHYKHRTSYYRHRKYCKHVKDNNSDNEDLKELLVTVIQENRDLHEVMQRQITELSNKPTTTTIHNNTCNLQVFLNEECKGALNMTEFIQSLDIKLHDLEYTRKHGIETGVMNMFMNGLRNVGTYKRPIHCTDMKRETLYVKDDDEWGKVDENYQIICNQLSTIAERQRKSIQHWEEANPSWNKSDAGKDKWINLVAALMDTIDFSDHRIIRSIAKEVKIK